MNRGSNGDRQITLRFRELCDAALPCTPRIFDEPGCSLGFEVRGHRHHHLFLLGAVVLSGVSVGSFIAYGPPGAFAGALLLGISGLMWAWTFVLRAHAHVYSFCEAQHTMQHAFTQGLGMRYVDYDLSKCRLGVHRVERSTLLGVTHCFALIVWCDANPVGIVAASRTYADVEQLINRLPQAGRRYVADAAA